MADFPESQLPEDPGYWERLAQSVRDDAAGPLAAYAAERNAWYGALAHRAPWLVAASAAAMLVLWWALPSVDSAARVGWIENSVTPSELSRIVGGVEPLSVDALMVQFPPPIDPEGPR